MSSPLSLGLSPCPNDTYIFYHLLREGLDGRDITPVFADVEELNRRALQGAELPITKVSCYAAALAGNDYEILPSGGALGRGCGPLLVSRLPYENEADLLRDLSRARILIPGETTTAHLLLRLFLSSAGINPGTDSPHPQMEPTLYSEILPALANGSADFGLIIHEERFTYPSYGVHAPLDLGAWWEKDTGLPIPLGCILVRRDHLWLFDALDQAIQRSIDYSAAHLSEAWPFIKDHARSLEDSAIRSHIDLYVTEYSRNPGEEGRAAFEALRQRARLLSPMAGSHAAKKPVL